MSPTTKWSQAILNYAKIVISNQRVWHTGINTERGAPWDIPPEFPSFHPKDLTQCVVNPFTDTPAIWRSDRPRLEFLIYKIDLWRYELTKYTRTRPEDCFSILPSPEIIEYGNQGNRHGQVTVWVSDGGEIFVTADDDFGVSDSESSEEEGEDIYAYRGECSFISVDV